MWLLHTRTLKHHYFISPEAVEEGYAILSHVWDEREDSFQDLQWIHARCESSGESPHDLVSPKIRMSCQLAAREGYRWVWIDTCCIDKTSSAELSESINSMFRYYALSLVCYAYLRDVPTEGAFDEPSRWEDPPFWTSKWHRRGWTLQELVAPQTVQFLSSSWEYLGSKSDLAETLKRITHIPAAVLKLKQRPADMSVAQHMSWAAWRKTTRLEDEAYCLLGLFDVSMPTLYGEGRKAFRRLQEEIMKQTHDTTLFAWGLRDVLVKDRLRREGQEESNLSLFATSPQDFVRSEYVEYTPSSGTCGQGDHGELHRERGDGLITFSVTPYGIRARLPVVDLDGISCSDLSWKDMSCPVLLVFGERHAAHDLHTTTLPVYRLGATRMVKIRPDSNVATHELQRAVWKDVLFEEPSQMPALRPRLYIPMNHAFSTTFYVPEHVLSARLSANEIKDVHVSTEPPEGQPSMTTVTFSRRLPHLAETQWCRMALQFGICPKRFTDSAYHQQHRFWANVVNRDLPPSAEGDSHQCPHDHVLFWPALQRKFHVGSGGRFGRSDAQCALRFELSQAASDIDQDTHPMPDNTPCIPRLTLSSIDFWSEGRRGFKEVHSVAEARAKSVYEEQTKKERRYGRIMSGPGSKPLSDS